MQHRLFASMRTRLLQFCGICFLGVLSAEATGPLAVGDFVLADTANQRVLRVTGTPTTVSVLYSSSEVSNAGANPVQIAGDLTFDDPTGYLYFGSDGTTKAWLRGGSNEGLFALASPSAFGAKLSPAAPLAAVQATATRADGTPYIVAGTSDVSGFFGYDRLGRDPLLRTSDAALVAWSASGGRAGMSKIVLRRLAPAAASSFWVLAGEGSLDGLGAPRSVLYEVSTAGTPLAESALSAADETWIAVARAANGTEAWVLAINATGPRVLEVRRNGTVTEILSTADIASLVGAGAALAPDLHVGTDGRLYLLATDGRLVGVDPALVGQPDFASSIRTVATPADYSLLGGTVNFSGAGFTAVGGPTVGYTITERTEPTGVVATRTQTFIQGREFITSPEFAVQAGGRRLSFWTFNGVRQSPVVGGAFIRPRVIVSEPIDAIAHYYLENEDGDGDRLADWWEFWMFGTRDRGPQENADGDFLSNEEEFKTGTDANLTDTLRSGGVSLRLSASTSYIVRNRYRYELRSEPLGLVSANGELSPGESYTTPRLLGEVSGFTFVGFEVDGVPRRDPSGVFITQLQITPTADTVIVARYLRTGADDDADGLLDTFEYQQFGTLARSGLDDSDGDGFANELEETIGYSANHADVLRSGGVSLRLSASFTYALGRSLYEVESVPLGLFASSSEYVTDGTARTTAFYGPSLVSGLAFGYWSVNGVRVGSPDGSARGQVSLNVVGNTVVRAHFFPPEQDSDGDGIFDVYEWRAHGSLANGADDDPDNDGFTLAQEKSLGFSPTTSDIVRSGGIAARMSSLVAYNANYRRFSLRSQPLGLLAESTTWQAPGTVVTTPRYSWTDQPSGYYFTHWTRNGVRIADPSGVAVGRVEFALEEDSDLVAHFTLATDDTDQDQVLDFAELRIAPDLLTYNAASDPDADGFSISLERSLGFGETNRDTLRSGGVSLRLSALTTVEFLPAPIGLTLSPNRIPRGLTAGTTVAFITPAAPAQGVSYAYDFVLGENDQDNFRFTIVGNELRLAQNLAADAPNLLRLRVRSTPSVGEAKIHFLDLQLADTILLPIANLVVDEETTAQFTASAIALPGAASRTFTLIDPPSGAMINAQTGAFTWTPGEAVGPSTVTLIVEVTDGLRTVQQSVLLTVREVNRPPVLAEIPDLTVVRQEELSFTVTATDPDLPAQNLSYSLMGQPTGASIETTTGAFTWTPDQSQAPGLYTFTVQVSDGVLTDAAEINVMVTGNHDPAYETLMEGVSTLEIPNVPGGISLNSPAWETILSGRNGSGITVPFLAVRSYGSGRVGICGDDAFFRTNQASNPIFLANLLRWLSGKQSPEVAYMSGRGALTSSAFAIAMLGQGLSITPYSGTFPPPAADVFVIGSTWSDSFTAAEIEALKDWVSSGKGLMLLGLGWSYPPYNGNRPLSDWAMTKIALPYQGGWTLDTLILGPNGPSGNQVVSILVTPQFTSAPLTVAITSGSAFSAILTASGTPTPTFSIGSGTLPPGLTLNETTGEISGSPTTAGNYTGTFEATNSGGSASQNFSFTVAVPSPTIYTQRTSFLTVANISSVQTFDNLVGTANYPDNHGAVFAHVVLGEPGITVDGIRYLGSGSTGVETYIHAEPDDNHLNGSPTIFGGRANLDIFLPPGITAFGFDYGLTTDATSFGTITVTFANGQVVEYPLPITQPSQFWGIVGDEVRHIRLIGNSFLYIMVDDVTRGVPTVGGNALTWLGYQLPPEIPVELRALLADADFDGISNLIEYALGLNPGLADAAEQIDLIVDEATLETTFAFQCRADDPALSFACEVSSDLQTWTSVLLTYDTHTQSWSTDNPILEIATATDLGEGIWQLEIRDTSGLAPVILRMRITYQP